MPDRDTYRADLEYALRVRQEAYLNAYRPPPFATQPHQVVHAPGENPMTEAAFGGGDPESGFDRAVAAQVMQERLAESAGQRLHEQMVGLINAPQPDPANPPERLTAETVRPAQLREMYYQGMMTYDNLRRTLQAEWTPEQRAEHAKAYEEQQAAQARAEALLAEYSTPEQRETWKAHKWIKVVGQQTGRTYRITNQRSFNVHCEANNTQYCAYPANASETPRADQVLAQMMWLVTDEMGFIRKANKNALNWDRPWRMDEAEQGQGRPDLAYLIDDVPDRDRQMRYYAHGDRVVRADLPAETWNDAPQYRMQIRNHGIGGLRPNLRPEWNGPAPRPVVDRTGREAWVPDGCIARGCVLEMHPDSTATQAPTHIFHGTDIVLTMRRREMDEGGRYDTNRKIKRRLEGLLHR